MGLQVSPWRGCPIRTSPDQSLLAAPRGFSQLATSFIGSWCQGIHRAPLFARTRRSISSIAHPSRQDLARSSSTCSPSAPRRNERVRSGCWPIAIDSSSLLCSCPGTSSSGSSPVVGRTDPRVRAADHNRPALSPSLGATKMRPALALQVEPQRSISTPMDVLVCVFYCTLIVPLGAEKLCPTTSERLFGTSSPSPSGGRWLARIIYSNSSAARPIPFFLVLFSFFLWFSGRRCRVQGCRSGGRPM
jgi:hypothetical protein